MKIRFVGDPRSGAFHMRGKQISAALKEKGVDAEAVPLGTELKNCVSVFVKQCPAPLVEQAKKNHCRVIFDPVDKFCRNDDLAESLSFRMFDEVIFCTLTAREYFKPLFNATLHVVYHHWDKALEKEMRRYLRYPQEIRPGYIGASFNHLFANELPDVTPIYNPSQWVEMAGLFNLHYSIKNPGADFFFKPTTKISTAAACMANILATNDPGTMELLPSEYPYLINKDNPTPTDVYEKLNHAYDTFGKEDWFLGLEMMNEVKEKTSIDTIISQYQELLK